MLDVMQDYVAKWKMTFNGKKCKVFLERWKGFEVEY